MKFKKLTAMCKKRKRIDMYEDAETKSRWLSSGSVVMRLGANCEVSPNGILTFKFPRTKEQIILFNTAQTRSSRTRRKRKRRRSCPIQ